MTIRRRRRREEAFRALCWVAVYLPLALLALLLAHALVEGLPRLGSAFVSDFPSASPERAGILPAIAGSLYVLSLAGVIAVPLGVGAAIYLEEYAPARWSHLVEMNLAQLAGLPSVLYGLLGLGVFVHVMGMGTTAISGALTLAMLVLPLVITTTREALRDVPGASREAALALGATRWETVRQVVLPVAWPRITTGVVQALARALGETAPLIMVGALAYVSFLPDGMSSPYTVLPVQIFHWVTRDGFVPNAAAGVLVLLSATLALNVLAVLLRQRLERVEAERQEVLP